MKIKLINLCAAVVLASAVWLNAEDAKPATKEAKPDSAEFARMKSLVGSWAGKVDMGAGLVDMTMTYRVVAAGSVLEERVFAGTPNEMTTMYFDKSGKIAATHYCMLGNRPQLQFRSADDQSITFDFDATCGIDVKKESHMHGMKIVFNDADTITTSCGAFMDGKAAPEHETVLKRVK